MTIHQPTRVSSTRVMPSGGGFLPTDLRRDLLFWAPLQRDLGFFGTGSPTFTRATTATYIDQDTGLVTSAASGEARFEANGYLSEGARTNLCLQSEDFSTTWIPGVATVSTNVLAAPDGTMTADSINETGAAATSFQVRQDITITADASLALSVYIKAANRSWVQLNLLNGVDGCNASFNVSAGTVGTAQAVGTGGTFTSATIEAVGSNGWYRCKLVGKIPAAATALRVRMYVAEGDDDITFDGLSQTSLYLWGAQVEEASFASSYIPTTTVAVARNADVLSFPASGNFDEATGTVYFEADVTAISAPAVRTPLAIENGVNDRYSFEIETDNDPAIVIVDGGATVASIATTADDFVADTVKAIAATYAADDVEFFTSGVTRGTDTDTSGALPTGLATINVGMDHANAEQPFGHLRNLYIFNRPLSAFEAARIR